jgi:hypothetical protein
MGTEKTQRLCSEIQLFDLCDLDTCSCKNGRYCTNPEILAKFEAIKEEDERAPQQYIGEEFDEDNEDEDEDADNPGFDDGHDDEGYEDDDL